MRVHVTITPHHPSEGVDNRQLEYNTNMKASSPDPTKSRTIQEDIEFRYALAKYRRDQVGSEAFFSNRHKKDREWHVLGAVRRLFDQHGLVFPTRAIEQESPDFLTYLSDGTPWHPIEIAEALREGEKRHEKYRDRNPPRLRRIHCASPNAPVPVGPIQKLISKKARKGYPENTCLIIYFDIWLYDFPDWSTRPEEQLRQAYLQAPFPDADAFARIIILTSGMDALLDIKRS